MLILWGLYIFIPNSSFEKGIMNVEDKDARNASKIWRPFFPPELLHPDKKIHIPVSFSVPDPQGQITINTSRREFLIRFEVFQKDQQ